MFYAEYQTPKGQWVTLPNSKGELSGDGKVNAEYEAAYHKRKFPFVRVRVVEVVEGDDQFLPGERLSLVS